MIGMYTWWQWLLYFYVYCFAGWLWECAYVSVKKKKFVNRGFLHLPLLPLYGSGAVTVLFVTMPFRDHLILLYLAGMVGASLLEMMTGLAMEALYKVKYWDYSDCFLNYKGVICLKASLLWGVFSVVMVKVAHARVERLLAPLPQTVILIGEAVITAAFVYDFYVSNRDALQLAQVLSAMEKAKAEMQEDLRRLEKELEEQKELLEQQLRQAGERAEEQIEAKIAEAISRNAEMVLQAEEFRRRMEESAEMRIEATRRRVEDMRRVTEHMVEEARLNALFRNAELYSKVQERREKYLCMQEERLERASRLSRSMMRRNPTASMKKHRELSEELRRRAENRMKRTTRS